MVRSVAILLDVNPLEYCGGAERWVLTLAKMLLKRGIDVAVYIPAVQSFFTRIDSIPIIGVRSLYRLFTRTLAHSIPDITVINTMKELAKTYDAIILNNVAIVFSPYIKNTKRIGVIHDHFLVCPLRDIQCLDKGYDVEVKNCIKCLFSLQGIKYMDLYIFRNRSLKCLESLDIAIFQSLTQLCNISSLLGRKIRVRSAVIGPIIDTSNIQKVRQRHGFAKELLSIMHIGGIKRSRGFDRFAALSKLIMTSDRLSINEIHIHGKIEEKEMYEYLRELLLIALIRNVKIHLGYIEYEHLLKELAGYACIIVSASRCTETAPLYVFEAFALGSLVLALRKPYGPYEYSLKILSCVSEEIADLYKEVAAELYEFFLYGSSSRLIDIIARLIDMYFSEAMYWKASDIAMNIIEQNIDKAIKLVLE